MPTGDKNTLFKICQKCTQPICWACSAEENESNQSCSWTSDIDAECSESGYLEEYVGDRHTSRCQIGRTGEGFFCHDFRYTCTSHLCRVCESICFRCHMRMCDACEARCACGTLIKKNVCIKCIHVEVCFKCFLAEKK